MPLKVHRLLFRSGSSEFSIFPYNGPNPDGFVDATVGSIVRANDGSLWRNSDGVTSWESLRGGTETLTASNTGSGAGVFKAKTGDDFAFRSITGSASVTVTQGLTTVTISSAAESLAAGIFGLGTASVIFDGVNPVLGVSPLPDTKLTRGSTMTQQYIQDRDWMLDNCTIASGVYVYAGGYRLFVKGVLTLEGYYGRWGFDGGSGTVALPGAAGAAGGAATIGSTAAGHIGGDTAAAVPAGVAGPSATGPFRFSNTAGGVGKGGAGGRNSSSAAGAIGGVITTTTAAGDLHNVVQAISGRYTSITTAFSAGSGGGGGRGQSGANIGGGGGGGSSGGQVVVCARRIVGSGSVLCYGGGGGAGFAGSGAGGGGGGGGGWATFIVGTGDFPSSDVSGGIGGAPGGIGTSLSGSNGGAGLTYMFRFNI